MRVRLASTLGERSPCRANGGTAMTDRARSAGVTALVFNEILLKSTTAVFSAL